MSFGGVRRGGSEPPWATFLHSGYFWSDIGRSKVDLGARKSAPKVAGREKGRSESAQATPVGPLNYGLIKDL